MDVVNTIVLPVVAIVIFALLGLLRGARREAYVSGAIALATLMSLQWGASWGNDLRSYVAGISAGDAAFYVTTAIMVLTVLVIGYGLGSSVVRGAPTSTSRVLGLLLGVLNGAAFAGWLLRFAFEFLDGRQATSPIYRSEFAQTMMIWAGWYPVALVALGAVVALVRAIKGDDEVQVTRETVAATTTAAPARPVPVAPNYGGYAPPPANVPPGPPPGYYGSPSAPTAAYTPPPPPIRQSPPPSAPMPPPYSQPYQQPAQPSIYVRPAATEPPAPSVTEAIPVDSTSPAVETRVVSEPSLPPDTSSAGAATVIPTGETKYHTPPFGMPAVEPVGAADKHACLSCGALYEPGQVFCTECGTRVAGA